MGCDGGTIPRRDELVKTKKKPEQKDKNSERLYRWQHCAVSQAPLQHPIVACELGRMYNKEEVLSRLLDRSTEPGMAHIKGLKDIKELGLTPNAAHEPGRSLTADVAPEQLTAEHGCPITGLEMNGHHRFSFVWTCGCVVSERALREVPTVTCHRCGVPYQEVDVVPLNPPEDELEGVKAAMNARRAAAKAAKKAKKEGKRTAEEDESQGASGSKGKKSAKHSDGAAGTSGDSSSSRAGQRVRGMASAVLRDKAFDKVRSAGFSVASDPQASEAYKSLFDTHKTAVKNPRAHWVTCNPQYF
ncbi:Protein RTF2 [Chionoecetes opilio]|uniref:Replication termination factor 2 n=1 Tax=Chionoecetes opilio TaxID=41210 RepID=A0A8J5CMC6_CHIOP|nr:Protein RTF2 [Chionoecetes opilio]